MPKPFSQLRARRDFLQPQIKLRLRLRQAARPEPFDQYTLAIIFGRFLIGPFQFDHIERRSSFLLLRFLLLAELFCKSSNVFCLSSSGACPAAFAAFSKVLPALPVLTGTRRLRNDGWNKRAKDEKATSIPRFLKFHGSAPTRALQFARRVNL